MENEGNKDLSDDGMSEQEQAIQLGFSVEIEDETIVAHQSPHWSEWDGGKIGGKPSWLNPRALPTQKLLCMSCSEKEQPLRFICQLYAPVETRNNPTGAFHRSLYVFCCPICSTPRVLRCQLPRNNEFYPSKGTMEETKSSKWKKHTSQYHMVNLCKVCGQQASGKCPKQQEYFCCKEHQKEYLRQTKRGGSIDKIWLPSVYAESEIVVEEEPSNKPDSDIDADETPGASTRLILKHKHPLFPQSSGDDEDDDSANDVKDEDLEQTDLNQMTGADKAEADDPVTLDFHARVGRRDAQEQVLRYCQWPEIAEKGGVSTGAPLWISSKNQAPSPLPPCPSCGSPRAFEFQIMPQMLHFLLKNEKEQRANQKTVPETTRQALLAAAQLGQQQEGGELPEEFRNTHEAAVQQVKDQLLLDENASIDWGVIAIYTCTMSCDAKTDADGELGAYKEEFAWRQPPLS